MSKKSKASPLTKEESRKTRCPYCLDPCVRIRKGKLRHHKASSGGVCIGVGKRIE